MTPADLVRALTARGLTVATAESLTGGLVCATLTEVPGASAVVRGGVVSYAADVKASVLGVDPALLARVGAVDGDVAAAMAAGVRDLLGADLGVATTGVAGPDPADGQPVGTVYVAVAGPAGTRVERKAFEGDRAQIRRASVESALRLLAADLPNLRDAGDEAGYRGATSTTPRAREEAP
ncbi:CinA family protein [uncultured Phycicoccus sp.]|uniref:CinA family protein n=1 Tax=uncultured Phycicoccus sp. TaxID=661422 RepID=UPI002639B46A|nr:CinA family protein [uncultured Phycicoccus sp.]